MEFRRFGSSEELAGPSRRFTTGGIGRQTVEMHVSSVVAQGGKRVVASMPSARPSHLQKHLHEPAKGNAGMCGGLWEKAVIGEARQRVDFEEL